MENNNINNSNKEIEIDLKQIFMVLLGKIGIIAAVGAVCAVIAFTYFNFIATEQYTSTTQIYIMDTESGVGSSSDVSMYTSLLDDCLQIIETNPVMDQVIAELGLDMTAEGLNGKVTAARAGTSRIISISVVDTSPVTAKRIADAVAGASAQKIEEVVGKELVNIVQPANMPTAPSSPATMRNTVIAFILGVFVTCAVIVIRFLLDDTIMTADDVEKYLGITVIGTIPLYGEEAELSRNKGKRKVTEKKTEQEQSVSKEKKVD